MKSLIIHPTRFRPEIARSSIQKWFDNAIGRLDFIYCLGVDEEDRELYKDCVDSFKDNPRFKVLYMSGERVPLDAKEAPTEEECKDYLTINTKINRLITDNPGYDWYLNTCDDTSPMEKWDEKMFETMDEYKGRIAILGYVDEIKKEMIMHSIASKEFIAFNDGKLLYEGYFHCNGDLELFILSRESKTLYPLPEKLHIIHDNCHTNHTEPDALSKMAYMLDGRIKGDKIFYRRKDEIIRKYLKRFNRPCAI